MTPGFHRLYSKLLLYVDRSRLAVQEAQKQESAPGSGAIRGPVSDALFREDEKGAKVPFG
jgi:hypothetical protein